MKASSNRNSVNEPREVMTAAEAAEYLQVHIKTLYDWIKSGELRIIKLGPRSTRILKQDIIRFLESRASAPSDALEGADMLSDWSEDPRKAEKAAEKSRLMATRKTKTKVNK
jgi:excisionase family DNA binding protein